jgi:hypothetical protein
MQDIVAIVIEKNTYDCTFVRFVHVNTSATRPERCEWAYKLQWRALRYNRKQAPNQLRGPMRPISISLRLVVRIDRPSIDLTPLELQQVPLAIVYEWKKD